MTKNVKLISAAAAAIIVGGGGALACVRIADQPLAESPASDTYPAGTSTMANRQSSEIYYRGVSLTRARTLGWPKIAEWQEAADRFPSIQSCLVDDAAEGASLRIDWSKLGSDVEASVCLSRVAASLGTPEKVVEWLEAYGFTVVDTRAADESTTSMEAPERAGTVIEAQWSIEKNGPLARRGIGAPLAQRALGHSVNTQIFISETGRIVSVNVVTNIL